MAVQLIHFAGTLQALLLAFYFWSNIRVRGNLFYGGFLFVLAWIITIGYLYDSKLILELPLLARTGFPLTALAGPLFYLGVRGQITERFRDELFSRSDWLLFLVPGGISLYLLPFYLSSPESKLSFLREDMVKLHLDCTIINFIAIACILFCTLLTLILLWRVGRLKLNYSPAQRSELLRQTVYTGLLVPILAYWSALSLLDPDSLNSGRVSALAALIIFLISLDRIYYNRSDAGKWEIPAPLYNKALLSLQQIDEITRRFDLLMAQERLYIDPELRLDDLTERLGVTRNHLSQAINRKYNRRLPDILNEYRVQEAIRLLSDPAYREYTILRIALESGFNSKSTFNAGFKRVTGKSPSDYKSLLQKGNG
jgi:AraC-like DNA-binding protein